MKRHNLLALVAVLAVALAGPTAAGQSSRPKVKGLATPVDASSAEHGVLVGRASAGGMLIQMELERANGMWMLMGSPAKWMEMGVTSSQLYHVEVKPIDPKSKTRIPYADVTFMAINKDTGEKVKGMLHPMWGGSGLHYALNSGLAGDGIYEAKVTVGVPTFARGMNDKRWMEPATGIFHFKLADGKLTEVSEPED
ncbi:MAG: iron transporter [Proteobacteria bacterium]|nr:iron transporter [Pseudomonadota bacterium]